MAGEDFGLANITDSLKRQNELQAIRHREEQEQKLRTDVANQEKTRILERSTKISQGLVDSLGPLVGTLDKAEKAAAEVEQLRESNNPLDFLDLVGKQVQNPQMYTRAGRQKSIAEAQQMMNARTNIAATQQNALQSLSALVDANLSNSGSALEGAKLDELQNKEVIDAEMTRVATQAQQLANNNALQAQKLAMMSEEETRSAHAASKGGSIDVGGVLLSAGQLEERMITLDQRKDLRESRTAATELKKQELADKLAKRELETMNVEELRPMVLNGDPRFKLEDIKQVYETKQKAQSEQIARLGQEFQFQDFGARVTVPAMQDVERMAPAIPPNTPLSSALTTYKNTVGTVMGMTKQFSDKGIPVPLEVMAAANTAMEESKKEMDTAITKEAKRRANGSKELETIYTEMFRGNPAPQADVETYLKERLDKNEPLTALLPPEVANSVSRRFNEIYSKSMQGGAMMPGFDKKQARADAIQQAIQEGVGEKITERTRDLFTLQLEQPSHPLYGVLNANQFLGNVAKADEEGKRLFQQTAGLNDQEMERFMAGQSIEGKVGPQNMVDLQRIQNQALFMRLDSVERGLGKKYADWWSTQGQQFIGQVTEGRKIASQQAGIQEMAMETFAGGMERNQQAAYMQGLSDALDSYDDRKQTRYNELVSFDQKPEHRQAMLLQWNPELSESEKKLFMKNFVMPIVVKGAENQQPYDAINGAIENAIDAGMTDDPVLAKILKKVAKSRSQDVEKLESVMEKPFWRSQPDEPRVGFQPNAWMRRTTAQRKYEWYREVLEGR